MNEFWQWFDSYVAPQLEARCNTFRKMLEHLDKFTHPVIIETGCVHEPDEKGKLCWTGHGCSTILFDKYVTFNGGRVYSADINQKRVDSARKLVSEKTKIFCSDGVEFMRNMAASNISPHLVYLDSFDIDWNMPTESQVHHYNELKAILPVLTPDTLVAMDDSPHAIFGKHFLDEKQHGELPLNVSIPMIRGKGGIIANYADELGVQLVWTEYQSAWQGFPGYRKCN